MQCLMNCWPKLKEEMDVGGVCLPYVQMENKPSCIQNYNAIRHTGQASIKLLSHIAPRNLQPIRHSMLFDVDFHLDRALET